MRDHLANERTLMAWARTALALVAVGLAVAKLSTFLEIAVYDHPKLAGRMPDPFWSQAIGVALVGLGSVVLLGGAIRSWRWAHRVGGTPPDMTELVVMVAMFLAISLGVLIYLVVT